MRLKYLLIPTLFISSLAYYGCCKAGLDGNASITIHVLSDSKNPIYGATVYIKYGQSKAPSSINGFDAHIEAPSNSNTVTFSGLKCGTYYLFAKGYDSVLVSPLSGGAPISILHKNRNKAANTNMYITP